MITVKREVPLSAAAKETARYVIAGGISFVCSYASCMGGRVPVAAALTAAVNPLLGSAVFAGGLGAFLLSGDLGRMAPDICAMLAVMLMKFLLSDVLGREITPRSAGVLAGCCYAVCGTALTLVLNSGGSGTIAAVLLHSIICGGAAYAFSYAIRYITGSAGILLNEIIAACGGAAILLAGSICGIHIWKLSPGRILGCTAVLFISRRSRSAANGALCAMALICAEMIYGGSDTVLLTGAAAFAAVAASLNKSSGRAAGCLVCAALFTVLISLARFPAGWDGAAIDIAISAAIFYFLPERFFTIFPSSETCINNNDGGARITAARIGFAAEAIGDIRRKLTEASELFDRSGENEASEFINGISEAVCSRCGRNNCWEINFDAAYEKFSQLREKLESAGAQSSLYSNGTLPEGFIGCPHRREILAAADRHRGITSYTRAAAIRIRPMRRLLIEQLDAVRTMLMNMSGEAREANLCDAELTAAVRGVLLSQGTVSLRCAVTSSDSGKLSVEAYFKDNSTPRLIRQSDAVAEKLSDVLGRVMSVPQIVSFGGISRLTSHETGRYRCSAQSCGASGGSEVSGDCTELFCDRQGKEYFLISDGMGSGRQAQVDSTMASGMLISLLRAGTCVPSALRIVNAAMYVRCGDERFATLDLGCFDSITGRFELYKQGAAATYILTGGEVKVIKAVSVPAGICEAIDSPHEPSAELSLKGGDAVVMVSDGVSEECEGYIRSVMTARAPEAGVLAAKIMEHCRGETKHRDDISVIAAVISG